MDKPIGNLKLLTTDGKIIDAILYCHQETTTIGGTTYRLLKLNTPADASGTTLSASTGSVARVVWGKFVYPLTGIQQILSATIYATYRAYTGGGTVDAEIDIKILQSNGTVRTTIATGVSKSSNLGTSWTTYTGANYSFSAYTVVDQTDYLEIDYVANVTAKKNGQYAYLRIDDNTLATSNQTRSQEWAFTNAPIKINEYFKTSEPSFVKRFNTLYSNFFNIRETFSPLLHRITSLQLYDFFKSIESMWPKILKGISLKEVFKLNEVFQKIGSFKKLVFDGLKGLETLRKNTVLKKIETLKSSETFSTSLYKLYILSLQEFFKTTEYFRKLLSKVMQERIQVREKANMVSKIVFYMITKVSETFKGIVGYKRFCSETFKQNEAYNKIVSYKKTLSDIMGQNETITKIVSYMRPFSDRLKQNETLQRIMSFKKFVSDNFRQNEILNKIFLYKKLLTDTLKQNEVFNRIVSLRRILSDAMKINYSLNIIYGFKRLFSDTIRQSVVLNKLVYLKKSIKDAWKTSEVTKKIFYFRAVSILNFKEVFMQVFIFKRLNFLKLGEERKNAVLKIFYEPFKSLEILFIKRTLTLRTEIVKVYESITKSFRNILSDVVKVQVSLKILKGVLATLKETFKVNEIFNRIASYKRFFMNMLKQNESLWFLKGIVKTFTDTLKLNETLNRIVSYKRFFSENIKSVENFGKKIKKAFLETIKTVYSLTYSTIGVLTQKLYDYLKARENMSFYYKTLAYATYSFTEAFKRLGFTKKVFDRFKTSETLTPLKSAKLFFQETIRFSHILNTISFFKKSVQDRIWSNEKISKFFNSIQFMRLKISDTVSKTVKRRLSDYIKTLEYKITRFTEKAYDIFSLKENVTFPYHYLTRTFVEGISIAFSLQKRIAKIVNDFMKANGLMNKITYFRRYTMDALKQNMSFAFKKTILASFMEKVKIDKRINFVFIKRLTDAKSIVFSLNFKLILPTKFFKFNETFSLNERYIFIFYSMIVERIGLSDSTKKVVEMIRKELFGVEEIFSAVKYFFAILLMRNIFLSEVLKILKSMRK